MCKEPALEQNRLPLASGATDHFVSVCVTSVQAQSKEGANSSPDRAAMSSLWVLLTASSTQSPGHSTVVGLHFPLMELKGSLSPQGIKIFEGHGALNGVLVA